MTIIIGGHETGLLDSSFTLLNRNDRNRAGSLGQGEETFVNVSNGNLLIQQRDAWLPSLGEDYALVRTYNARGVASDAQQHEDARWMFSTLVRLEARNDGGSTYYELTYGDGSVFEFRYDAARGVYVSTDGAGAFETLTVLSAVHDHDPAFVVTRANQTQLTFAKQGALLSSVDTNGVRVDYVYEADRLVRVNDDQGHVLNYVYENGVLAQVTDEAAGVLVQYHYQNGRLVEVIDRFGQSTKYFYTTDGFINRILLPTQQTVDGQVETYAARELLIEYEEINWRGDNQARAMVVKSLTDAEGGVTTFDYAFQFSQGASGSSRGHLRKAGSTTTSDKFFEGGTTTVVDALGNNRATSNETLYREWRVANGYYDLYDAANTDAGYLAQVAAIRQAHSLTYTYLANGYITEVVDQQGFKTLYTYDAQENLTSITDRNGYGATTSDSDYFRALRAELGYTDAAGLGKLVAELTDADKTAILAHFTTSFTYDERGNLLTRTDAEGNVSSFTYTSFNKLASETSAVGHALTTSDEAQYQQKRAELGYASSVSGLSAADIQALLDRYTTRYEYDANQNLIQRTDAGGDVTRFEYDLSGNLTRRIVFLDASDLTDPARQQVTQYFYDAFGNNIETIDAEDNHTFSQYDHFGNLTRFTDANGGVTLYTYDADNRLLSVIDPESHVTLNRYDAVGNRISVTDANGHPVVYLYDRNNLLIATIDNSDADPAQDRTTSFTYDVVGNRTQVTDAEGRSTTYAYNTRRELVEMLSAEVEDETGVLRQYSSTYAYDGEGNRISSTNNRGFTTEVLYTPTGLIRQSTDPTGHITRFTYDANYNQVLIVAGLQLPEAKRQILRFAYDEEDQLIAQTDAEGNTTGYAYDAPGNRASVTDANGHTTEFLYDRNNRLLTEIRPEVIDPRTGQPVRYEVTHQYDANGNEIATTDEEGHTTHFAFDKDDRLVLIEDANGIQTVYTYDSRHNRTGVLIGVQAHLDATGHVVVDDQTDAQATTYVYDEFNQLIAKTDGVGNALAASDAALYQTQRQDLGYAALVADLNDADKAALKNLYTERYTYDRVGNYLSTTDHLGRTTSFQYDALNRQVARTDVLGNSTTYRYDGNGNRTSMTDALGRVTTFQYDANDRLTDTTDALSVITHRDYDAFGNLTTQTRAAGTDEARTTTYEYDLNNRLIRDTDPEGHGRTYEYDAVGNRLRVTDARGNATQYVYDALNRNIKIIDPLSFETKFEYDGVGNRLALIDARGGIARFDYDPGNRLLRTTDAEGRETRFQYDVRGNRIEVTDGNGNVTQFVYDAQNNLREVIDALGNSTTHDYDRVYNRISTTDGNGHTTVYALDAINRLIETTDAEGNVTRYSYDAVGNRLTQTDALGRVTTFTYDARDQLIRSTDANGVDITYAYDLVGNRVAITRAANTSDAATTTFAYNLDDQLVSQTDALGNTTSYEYDPNHNRTVVTDPNGHSTTYHYDANDRVESIVDPLGNTIQYVYDGNGNRVQVIDARGFTGTTYYNANNEVALAVDAEGFATSFVYDDNGNVVQQTLHAQPLSLPLNPAVQPTPAIDVRDQVTQLAYDSLNRLSARIDAEGFRAEFRYDAVGNRVETKQFLDLAGTRIASTRSYFDAVNRQIAGLSAEGYLTENRYDAVGNRVEHIQYDQQVAAPVDGSRPQPAPGDGGRTTGFAYDALNRMVRQTSALGVDTEYVYDDRGNRLSMTEAAGTADARTTLYRYDAADRYVETTNALGIVTQLELDANGNVVTRREASGTPQQRLFTFVYDANNRVVQQTDALGVTTETIYDAAGNVTQRTAASGLPEARTETFTYDRNNRQVAAVNAAGERTDYEYDAAGNRTRLTQAPGLPEERTNTFSYDRDNRLVAATDAMGTVTEHRYDGAGNKIATIQAVGLAEQRETSFAYDLDNRLVEIVDPMGGVTLYEYDVLGNQTRIINANGGVQQNTFDAIGQALSSLSAGGVLTSNTYDLRGNLVAVTQSFADGSDARTTTYGYDLLNRQARVTDGEGFSTSMVYDAFGNQLSIIHGQYLVDAGDPSYDPAAAALAFPETNTFAYDAANRMLSMTDGEGNVTTYAYDAVGNRLAVTEAANSAPRTTQYTYDLANRRLETRTPENGVTRFAYDHVGNKIAEDALQSGDETTGVWIHKAFEYDKNGRLAAEVDPYGVRTEYAYDAMANMLSRTAAAGTSEARTVRMEYDFNNRKTADIDALGNRTQYAYDAMGNRTKLTDALGRAVHYYFNGANQLTLMVDPEGFINTFEFDAAGNRVEERVYMTRTTAPLDDLVPPVPVSSGQDRIVSLAYDRANRLVARTDADGKRTEVAYDGAGNKIAETNFANTSAPRTMAYEYDLNGRLMRFTDVDGSVTAFTYDGANNRLSEIFSNPTDVNAVRATFYEYDLNNRRVRETFDPGGLNIVLTTAYDKLANVTTRTDGNGHATTFTYDLNNRLTGQRDALGNETAFQYDAVGNQIEFTDARGNTTRFVYDGNNRQIQEIQPQVDVYTIGGGAASINPTITTQYDAVGNAVQMVDAKGAVTTHYFDGNGRMVAELSGDHVLREFSYDAAGDKVTESLYMTRLTAADHDPALRPTPPAGEVRTTTYEYDLAGRLTKTTYPSAEITALADVGTNNPTPTKVTKQVDERRVYDAFGNEVESFDREGNRAVSYYDVKGRKVAVVDALGYLVEWDYDAQGNQIQQRVYADPLDPATVSASVRPMQPTGEVYVTDFLYDAASRRIQETGPQIEVFDPVAQTTSFVRSVTVFTYDSAGNALTKTLGAGTSQAITEYSYYDAANRRVAVVNGGRVLHLYQYDANGNVTTQNRLFNTVSAGIDLSQLDGSDDLAALVAADANNDQSTSFAYDALNRLTQETDLMGPGSTDDLVKHYRYDAAMGRTSLQDEDGFVTRTGYDAMDRVLQTINADGSGTLYEYDAAGNQIFVFTGKMANAASPATAINASLSDELRLSWEVAGNTPQTWVVYDTVSRTEISSYANRTPTQVSFTGSASAALTASSTGTTVYFRVVTQDAAGNLTWTGEQSLTVPPRFTAVAVAQPSADSLTVSAQFDAGVASPELLYGPPGNLSQVAAFVLQADGSYRATLTGLSDPAALNFKLRWQDSAGRTYSSAEGSFAYDGGQVGIVSDVGQGTVTDGTEIKYNISLSTRVPNAYAAGLTLLQAQWRLAGSTTGFAATGVTGTDSGQGYTTFAAVLGDDAPLDAGTYEIVLSGVREDGTSVVLDTFNFTLGGSGTPSVQQSLSWVAPPVGDGQLVIIDGNSVATTRTLDGRVVADADLAVGSVGYDVLYTQASATTSTFGRASTELSHTVQIDSTAVTSGEPPVITGYDIGVDATFTPTEIARMGGNVGLGWRVLGSTGPFNDVAMSLAGNTFSATLAGLAAGQYELRLSYADTDGNTVIASEHVADTAVASANQIVITGYDLGVSAQFDASETAKIAGAPHLAWRPAGSGEAFANDVTLASSGANAFSTTLIDLDAGEYDLKLYYFDDEGREVIVAWQRVEASETADTVGYSQTVLARETGGTVTADAQGVLALAPGVYAGPLDASQLLTALTLEATPTGSPGGSRDADGRDTGYFARNVYNALNYRIATNENDGLWREFGVDANGRTVETRLYGEEGAPSFIASYVAVDARGRKVAEFSAPEATSTGTERAVRRYAYNVLDKMTQDTDALGNTRRYEYNALGTLVREIDPYGGTKETRIDRFGRETAMVSELGHVSRRFYDAQGRMIEERNAAGNSTTYGYDAFDRQIRMTDGVGDVMRYAYDQRDRLVSQAAPQGEALTTSDAFWALEERQRLGFTITETDAGGNPVVRAKTAAELSDADRQALIALYTASFAYDGRNNRTSTLYPLGQRTDEVYDGLGRVIDTQLFLDGVATHSQRAYDAYGNLIAETDAEGRTKTHVYGGFGRLLQDFDEDGNQVAYVYDDYGRIEREFDPDGAKDIRKTYDDAGRLLSIQDLATGVSTTYTYDLVGRRLSEVITTPGNEHNRDISYEYDALGQLVHWSDNVTGLHLNLLFDSEGNRIRAYTDTGYDPLGKNTGANPNYRYVDHVYSFDAARRVTQEVQRTTDATGNVSDAIINGYGYDAAGNRITWNNQGTMVAYVYDANARAVRGDFMTGSDSNRQSWTYDAMGNVLSFRTFKNGSQTASTVNEYNDANRTTKTVKDDQTTTQTYDRSMRITQTVLRQNGKTYYYNQSYYGDGRERSTTAYGDASGNSTSSYDANKIRTGVNLGKGDGQDRAETKSFVADNEGHILFQFHDDGKSGTREIREYVYANGNPVGETGHGTDGQTEVKLDTGNYSLINNLSDTFPGGVLSYTTRDGDTLQGIAAQMYGNPSLWFVIADANGLMPGEPLKAGQSIQIPNSVKSGRLTAENHRVYSEGEIVGSTLPNLKTPPPPKPKKGCGSIIMIIIIVVIAIVVSVITAGIAAPLAAAAVGAVGATAGTLAAFAVTALVYAAVGAVVAAVGSIVQQGLFIALGYQDKFSWKAVGSAALSGALSGAASGIGAAAKAASTAGQLSAAGAQYAKVASAALQASSAAAPQLLENGKITSWTSIAAAAVGGYASAGQEIAKGETAFATAQANVAKSAEAIAQANQLGQAAQKAAEAAGRLSTISNYVSPWVQLAETYVRNDGKLTPADWAGAVGSTLSQAVSDKYGATGNTLGDKLQNAALRLGSNVIVAGALRHYDKDAARSYFENGVGQVVGQFIGDYVGQGIKNTFFKEEVKQYARVYDSSKGAFVDAETGELVVLPSSSQQEASNYRSFQKDANGNYVDQYGNPAPLMYADSGQIMTDAGPAGAPAEPTGPVIESRKLKPGESFWNIAKQQLGPGASDAEIQKQVYALMELNPGLDPRRLQIGQEINVISPNSGIEISGETLAGYRQSDAEYQNYRAEQARIAEQRAAQQAAPTQEGSFLSGPNGGPPTDSYLSGADGYDLFSLRPQTAGPGLVTSYDTYRRTQYLNAISEMSDDAVGKVRSARVANDLDAAETTAREANRMRNEMRTGSQKKLTPGGRALSELLEQDRSWQPVFDKYSEGKEPTFDTYEKIAQKSGASNRSVKYLTRFGKVAGPAATVYGAYVAVDEVVQAAPADRPRVAAREAGGIVGGAVVGGAATWGAIAATAFFVSNPVGWTAAAVIGIGVVAGAVGGYYGSEGGRALGEAGYNKWFR